MSRAELEEKFGINLHDVTAPDFGRFNAETNKWYMEHKAGASYTPGGPMPPALPAQ